MCVVSTVCIVLLLIVRTKGDPNDQNDHFNNAYSPPAVNFNDIFTNSISMLAEEPGVATAAKSEDFHINSIPTQFVEFPSQNTETTTKMTPPPPRYILNSSYLNKDDIETTSIQPIANTTDESSTEKHKESAVEVIPIKKNNMQRGVLDLLFPASRVRTFKGIFDTFKRILSHTFKKR